MPWIAPGVRLPFAPGRVAVAIAPRPSPTRKIQPAGDAQGASSRRYRMLPAAPN
jgi:hypothetical protein